MAKTLPMLTSTGSGWITDTTIIAERLLYSTYATDNIQSRLFGSSVFSMATALKENDLDVLNTIRSLESGLTDMYERVFPDNVQVEVTMQEKEDDRTYTALISVNFVEDGKQYDLRNILKVNNNIASEIIRHVNN